MIQAEPYKYRLHEAFTHVYGANKRIAISLFCYVNKVSRKTVLRDMNALKKEIRNIPATRLNAYAMFLEVPVCDLIHSSTHKNPPTHAVKLPKSAR